MSSVTPKKHTKQNPSTNAGEIINIIKVSINRNIIQKIKGAIIHAWIHDFEDQYLKTFKVCLDNATDPKTVISTVYKRMEIYDYTNDITVIVRYTKDNKFSVLASYSKEEIEYAEFQRWKKLHNKEK